MEVTPDHWLKASPGEPSVSRQPLAGGTLMETRRCLVIHFTAGASGKSSIDFWRTRAAKGASAHIVIERTGEIIQCRPFSRTCGHAGVSNWRDPKTGTLYGNLNSCSIGIELANAGEEKVKWAMIQPGFRTVKARHKNGGPVSEWEAFPESQLASALTVARALVARYHLDDVVGHEDIAPDRKTDPGPAFPMQKFREALGFAGLPVVFKA